MTYTWLACETTTGRVLSEVPVGQGWSAQRHLTGGQFSGSLVLPALDPAERRAELLTFTEPGRCTLALDRDGRCVGEWIIWRRSTPGADGPIPLSGQELVSYFTLPQIPTGSFSQVDQLDIAAWMVRQAIDGQGGKGKVTLTVPNPSPSGRLRDRTYIAYEASIGQRLQELSQVIDGFDYWIDSVWDWSAGYQRVARTMRFGYPQAGRVTGLVFDDQGSSIVSLAFDEDATLLGTRAISLCSGDDAGQIVGVAESDALLDQGYPALDVTHSWTSVNKTSTALAYAQALLAESQSPEVPPTVSVLADGDPALGDWQLGDTVHLSVGERTNLPLGYERDVRILGWTLAEPGDGPELVALEVSSL